MAVSLYLKTQMISAVLFQYMYLKSSLSMELSETNLCKTFSFTVSENGKTKF